MLSKHVNAFVCFKAVCGVENCNDLSRWQSQAHITAASADYVKQKNLKVYKIKTGFWDLLIQKANTYQSFTYLIALKCLTCFLISTGFLGAFAGLALTHSTCLSWSNIPRLITLTRLPSSSWYWSTFLPENSTNKIKKGLTETKQFRQNKKWVLA